MGVRAIKERMRRQVHDHMGIPALYRETPESAWVPVSVRVHEKFTRMGDVPGLDAAQYTDISPRLVFLVEQVAAPKHGAAVAISATEAWEVVESDYPDDITVTAEARRLSATLAATFPRPEQA